MHTLQQFLKSTKWISRVLSLLWFIFSVLTIDSFESLTTHFSLFLLPAIIIELCSNPVTKTSNSKFLRFLTTTKIVSRVLILLWIYGAFFSPFARSQHSWAEYFSGVIVYSILFLGPALGVEIYKNPVLNDFKNKKAERRKPHLFINYRSPRLNKFKDKHISGCKIAAFICLILCLVGTYAYLQNPIDDPVAGNQASGNLSVAIVFGIATIILFILSLKAPKTKEEAKERKKTRPKPTIMQAIGGMVLSLIGGSFSVALIMPILALTDKEFMSTLGTEGIAVEIFMGVCGLVLLFIGVDYLRGTHGDSARERKKSALQRKEYERRMAPYRGLHLSEQEIRNIEKEISLPNIEYVPIILSSKEIAVYRANASIAETKSRVVGRTGSYGGGSVRIAKGFSIHTGGSKSQPIYGEVTTQFLGEFFITTERVVFLGEQKGFDLPIRKITAFFVSGGRLKIQSGQRVFEVIISAPYLAQTVFEAVSTGGIPIENSSDIFDNHMEVEDDPEQTDGNPIYVSNELFKDAVDVILEHGQASASLLQRYLRCGYSHAARLLDELEAHQIIGAFANSKPREILISEEEWEDMRLNIIFDEEKGSYDFSKSAEEPEDISCVDGMDGHKFEYFCASLLRKNGFTNVEVTPGSGDQGVDILAEKGGVKYAIQCKNYASPLSNTPVQEVNAGKIFYGCHVGVVMTNSTFTLGAKELAKATGVLLWNREVVQEMIREKTRS